MSDNQSEGEGDFTNEAKYRQYSASVERALKSFELSTEWHDLISCLARINKVGGNINIHILSGVSVEIRLIQMIIYEAHLI